MLLYCRSLLGPHEVSHVLGEAVEYRKSAGFPSCVVLLGGFLEILDKQLY